VTPAGAPATPNWAWLDYWRDARLAACVPEHPASARAIEESWRGFFAECDDHARVLDIATGNGVVLAHAATAARDAGRRLELTGVDLARIDPLRYVPGLAELLGGATFLGEVAAEALPFAGGSFDVLVSQYGLEYADLEQALGEAARVLTPGGRLRWLAHAEASAVVTQQQAQLAELDFMLSSGGPFEAMRAFVASLSRSPPGGTPAQALAAALRDAEAFCRAHPPAHTVRQLCESFAEVAASAQAYRPADIEHMLVFNVEAMGAHRQRIRDLLAARLTPDREQRVRAILQGPAWRSLQVTDLRVPDTGSLVGRVIEASRAH
jgi:SAM-dependent methyltransferase